MIGSNRQGNESKLNGVSKNNSNFNLNICDVHLLKHFANSNHTYW